MPQSPLALFCKKVHKGEYQKFLRAYFDCGSMDNEVKYCASKVGNSKALIVQVVSVQRDARSVPKAAGGSKSIYATSGSSNREDHRARVCTYVLMGRDEVHMPDVITSTYLILGTFVFTLMVSGSTLSFACSDILKEKY